LDREFPRGDGRGAQPAAVCPIPCDTEDLTHPPGTGGPPPPTLHRWRGVFYRSRFPPPHRSRSQPEGGVWTPSPHSQHPGRSDHMLAPRGCHIFGWWASIFRRLVCRVMARFFERVDGSRPEFVPNRRSVYFHGHEKSGTRFPPLGNERPTSPRSLSATIPSLMVPRPCAVRVRAPLSPALPRRRSPSAAPSASLACRPGSSLPASGMRPPPWSVSLFPPSLNKKSRGPAECPSLASAPSPAGPRGPPSNGGGTEPGAVGVPLNPGARRHGRPLDAVRRGRARHAPRGVRVVAGGGVGCHAPQPHAPEAVERHVTRRILHNRRNTPGNRDSPVWFVLQTRAYEPPQPRYPWDPSMHHVNPIRPRSRRHPAGFGGEQDPRATHRL